jgi:acetyl-CoA carboxylase biotin carboxyl carrier protein
MAESTRRNSTQKSTAQAATPPSPSGASLSLEDLRQLFSLMQAHDIAELNLEQGGMKVSVSTTAAHRHPVSLAMPYAAPSAVAPPYTHAPAPSSASEPPSPAKSAPTKSEEAPNEYPYAVPINSPMVGTFYRASSPEAPSFVNVGDIIKPGQVICIVEAMKLMNELKAEISGKVVKIVASNGNPVQFGQPLFLVEPE